MRTTAEFQAMREERELLKELAELPPSQFAKRVVEERPEFSTREMLRHIAKGMNISIQELAGDIIAAKALEADKREMSVTNANRVYRIIAIDSKGNAEWEPRYSPAPETISKKEWEAGHSTIENSERRSIVKATIFAERATRPDYGYARELLSRIGNEKGAVISGLPNGTVKVLSVHRAIEKEYADRAGQKAFAEFKAGRERIEAIENEIAAVPLSKGGTIESRIPAALKKERAKALDSMKAIRARVEKANARIEAANSPSADNLRVELVEEYDAYSSIPGATAIESLELPNAIVRRPFRESIRIKARREPISPVECEVLKNEAEKEWAIALAEFKKEREIRDAALASKEREEKENERSARNAAYKERQAIAARNRRANKKGK